eukprot:Em0006g1034a
MERTTLSGKLFIGTLTLFAAIGGFLFGYDTGIISGSLLKLRVEFALSVAWQEAVVSVTVGAAALSSIVAGPSCDMFGRRPVLLAASVVFTIGAVLMGAAQNAIMLLVGRIVVGLGVGFAAMAVPMYIAEVSPASIRGKLILINSMFITGGMFSATVLAGALSSLPLHIGWRIMLGLAGVPSVIMFVGFIFLPESPRWLVFHGHEDKARRVLRQIRGHSEVEEELKMITDDYQEHLKSHIGCIQQVKKFFTSYPIMMALLVGCSLQMFQQLCGINTILYYTASIIEMAGYEDNDAIWLSVIPGFSNFFFTLVGLVLVDRLGRRKLWFISNAGLVLGLTMLIAAFLLKDSHGLKATPLSIDSTCGYKSCWSCTADSSCGFCADYDPHTQQYLHGTCSNGLVNGSYFNNISICDLHTEYVNNSGNLSYTPTTLERKWFFSSCPDSLFGPLAIISLFVYLAFFAPGVGPLAWTINAEIYPTWARSTGIALATSTNWVFNMIVSITFLSLVHALGQPLTFGLYTVLSCISLFFVMLFLPETKGKTLEDMEHLFQRPYFMRWCRQRILWKRLQEEQEE